MKGLLNCRRPHPHLDQNLPVSIWLAPFCDKPLLEFYLDLFVYLEVPEVLLVIEPGQEALMRHYSTGSAWGLRLHYAEGVPGEVLPETLERLKAQLHDDLLIIDGPLFPFYHRQHLKPLRVPAEGSVIYSLNQRHLSLTDNIFLIPQAQLALLLAENCFDTWVKMPLDHHPEIRFPVVPIDSLSAYLQLNLEVLQHGDGFDLPMPAEAPGFWKGRQVQIASGARLTPPLWLGTATEVGPEVELEHSLLLGPVRLENTQLRECLVLGPSYLHGVSLTHRIIWGHRSYHPTTGQWEKLEPLWNWKALLEAPMARQEKQVRESQWVQRFLRWRRPLFALLAGFVHSSHQRWLCNQSGEILSLPVYRKRKRPTWLEQLFFAWQLQWVPWLEAVEKGQLWLVGNQLQEDSPAARLLIQRLPVYAPGVFSYAGWRGRTGDLAWLDELHYCQAASPDFDRQILAACLQA